MSLELTALKFSVNTTELDDAATKIKGLITEVSGLSKAMSGLTKETASASKAQSQANLNNAKAETELAKAIAITTKSEEQSTKAADKKVKSNEKVAKATKDATLAYLGLSDSLERTRDLMSEGWSRGEATQIKLAESAGLVGDSLQYVKTVLKDIGGLSASPFDNSLGSIRSLIKESDGLILRSKLVAQGIELNNKQLTLYARLAAEASVEVKKMGMDPNQGVGLVKYNQLLQDSQNEFMKIAVANKAMIDGEKNLGKQHRETASAKAFLIKEDERMISVQEQINGGTLRSITIAEKAATATANYARNLRLAGVSGQEAANKLAVYSKMQQDVASKEEARVAANLARGISPQLTDIAVSLWSGQAPLTVLLQQGGQLRDMFQLSGLEASKLGATMKTAFTSMLPSIMAVGGAVGGLLVDGFMSAGNAATNFVGKITGISSLMESAKRALASMGESGFSLIGTINTLGRSFSILAGMLIASVITGLIALAVAMKEVIQQESELSKAMNLTGGALGLTTSGATDLAKVYGSAKGNIGAFTEAITESAKAGSITKDNLYAVTSAAIELEKATGTAVKETIKNFAKLAEEPSKSFIALAKDIGTIDPVIVELVQSLERNGRVAEATTVATNAYSAAIKDAALNIKIEMGFLEGFFKGIGSAAGGMWNNILNIGRKDDLGTQLIKATNVVDSRAKEGRSWYQTEAAYREELVFLKEIQTSIQNQIKDETALGKKKEDNVRITALGEEREKLKATYSQNEVKRADVIKKTQILYNGLIEAAGDDQAKVNFLRQEELKVIKDINEKLKDPATKKVQLSEKQKEINKGLEEYTDIQNKVLGISKEFNNQILRQKLLRDEGLKTQEEYEVVVNDLVKTQKFSTDEIANQVKAEKEMARALDDKLKLEATLLKIQQEQSSVYQKNQEGITQETASLSLRAELLGKTEEEQKKINESYKVQGELSKINSKYHKDRLELAQKYMKLINDGETVDFSAYDQQVKDSLNQQGEEAKLVWAGVAMSAKESYKAEMDTISDIVMTSLFEGGKAGSKMIKDELKKALMKPIRVVVDAVVNTVIQGGMSSIGLGGAASVSGVGMSGVMSAISASSGMASITQGIANILPASFSSALGLSSSSLQASNAALLGGGSSAEAAAKAAGAAGNATALSSMATTAGSILSYASALNSLSEGKIGAAAGTTLGQYFGGPLGAFIGGKIGGALDEAFAGETRSGASYTTANGKAVFEKGPSGGEIAGYQSRLMLENAMKAITGTLETIGSKATLSGFVAGLESSDKEKGFAYAGGKVGGKSFGEFLGRDGGQFDMVSQDAKEAFAKYGTQLSQSILEALQITEDIPKALNDMLTGIDISKLTSEETDALLSTVTTLVTSVAGFKEGILSLPFESLKNLSFDAAAGLIAAAGGMDNLNNNLVGFYDNFYSDVEKTANLTSVTTKAFADLDKVMPEVNSELNNWYKQQVLSAMALDQSIPANAKMTAGLLSLQGNVIGLTASLAEIEEAVTEVDTAAEDFAANLQKVTDNLNSIGGGLQDQWDKLYLSEADYRAKQIKGMTALQIAQYDTNTALQKSIDTFKLFADKVSAFQKQINDDYLASIKATDDAYNALIKSQETEIKLLQDRTSITDSALNALGESIESEKQRIQLLIEGEAVSTEAAKSQVSAIKSIFELLTSSIKELRSEVTSTAEMQLSTAKDLIQLAISSGNLPSQEILSEAIGSVKTGLSANTFSTKTDRDRAFLVFANDLEKLSDIAKPQLSTAEQLLVNSESSIKFYKDQLIALDAQLEQAQDQVKLLRGISTQAKSIDNALIDLNQAISSERESFGLIQSIKDQVKVSTDTYNELRGLNTGVLSLTESIQALIAAILAETTAGATNALVNPSKPRAVQPFTEEERNTVIGMAEAAASAKGTTREAELYNYAKSQGFTDEMIDVKMGFAVGTAKSWSKDNSTAIASNPSVYDSGIKPDYSYITPFTPEELQTVSSLAIAAGLSAGTSAEVALINYAKSQGYTSGMLDRKMGFPSGTSVAYAIGHGLPAFERGINNVPYDMTARIHEGEAIVPKQFNPFNPNANSSMSGGNSEMVQELRELKGEVQLLRVEARSSAISAAKLNNNFERSIVPTNEGDALLVKTAV